jgi:hypothetical protein
MVNNLSYAFIRGLLAEAGIKVVPDSDGSLLTVLKDNEDFGHKILIRYIVKDDWLHIVGQASGYTVPPERRQDVLVALNLHNMNHPRCGGALHDDTVMFKFSLLVDSPVSVDYVLENGIKASTNSIRSSFVEFDKFIKDIDGNYKSFFLPVIGSKR